MKIVYISVPIMEDFGNTNNIFSMHFHSQVGSRVCLVIAFLVASSKDFVNDLLSGNKSLHLSESNGLGTFGDGSLGEMLPQVAIRCGLPIIFNWPAYSELVQDTLALSMKAWLSEPIWTGPLATIATIAAASSVLVELPP